jgi:hypothetical protein
MQARAALLIDNILVYLTIMPILFIVLAFIACVASSWEESLKRKRVRRDYLLLLKKELNEK